MVDSIEISDPRLDVVVQPLVGELDAYARGANDWVAGTAVDEFGKDADGTYYYDTRGADYGEGVLLAIDPVDDSIYLVG